MNLSLSKKAIFYKDIGMVDAIGDGIVIIKGLTNVANGEWFHFVLVCSDCRISFKFKYR